MLDTKLSSIYAQTLIISGRFFRGDKMDPRIKVIYIRQLSKHRYGDSGIVSSRLSEWPGHANYTNEEILKWLKMGIRWHSE